MYVITFGKKTIKERTRKGAKMFISILEQNHIKYEVNEVL